MANNKIKETLNQGAQLSDGETFIIVNKWKKKTEGELITLQISHAERGSEEGGSYSFTVDKKFLLSQKEFDEWLALLMQVSNQKL